MVATTTTTATDCDFFSHRKLSMDSKETVGVESCADTMSIQSTVTDPVLAEKEQKAVSLSKVCVVAVLVLAVTVMATVTYTTIAAEENNDFKSQFNSYATEIISVSREHVQNSFGAIEAFSVSISSHVKHSNQSWPFVTVPDYEARANRAASQAGANNVAFCPIIYKDEDKIKFEQTAQERARPYYEETLEYIGSNTSVDMLIGQTTDFIYSLAGRDRVKDDLPGPWPIIWQNAPWFDLMPLFQINYNLDSTPYLSSLDAYETMRATGAATISVVELLHRDYIESQIFQPIFEEINQGGNKLKKIVGLVWVLIGWENYFQNLIPDGVGGMVVVMESSCGHEAVTYEINGLESRLVGRGDLHDAKYDDLKVSADFVTLEKDVEVPEGRCATELYMHVYPTDDLRDDFTSNRAIIYTFGVVAIFAFTALVFAIFDYSVRRRQQKVMARVLKQDKIVSNLFPSMIKNRLYGEDSSLGEKEFEIIPDGDHLSSAAPIADLFPSVTICFADIAGFTAWSSQREPPQVFMLLESIYLEFDRIAIRHGVFKIETVGDCYVSTVGIIQPRADHASVMAKFARECMQTVSNVTRKLEVSLGPDTSDLEIRMGMNSGQVTAGVLRGTGSRFQLFGDSVNTAARMESTSKKSRIQLSDSTANLLIQQGKEKWIHPREEKIFVKGKGEMQTYWLETTLEESETVGASGSNLSTSRAGAEMAPVIDISDALDDRNTTMSKTERLVEWNVDVLSKLLQQILAARENNSLHPEEVRRVEEEMIGQGSTVLEECKEIITLPKLGLADIEKRLDPNDIILSSRVVSQLRDYITRIAAMYKENVFHNFEHASHVTASVRKLLSRIVSFDNYSSHHSGVTNLGALDIADLVGHSYGITSDPLTQFAVVFTAVIHDVDHPGVTNAQLVKENVPIVSLYKEKSVAEQNSVELAWKLLMNPRYADLRACIYSTEHELKRFRQLVVNTLMATDICDKELQALRKARWAKAFSETPIDSTPEDDTNRKATIVIEHLIQASDVSHTMQHWHIYKQWNERFFMECYGAYCAGRAESDPSVGWYKGEIGFFDFYIIPLAKKLENCGVFGVSSHEYLNYALANRDEWEREGESIVKGYLEKYHREHAV